MEMRVDELALSTATLDSTSDPAHRALPPSRTILVRTQLVKRADVASRRLEGGSADTTTTTMTTTTTTSWNNGPAKSRSVSPPTSEIKAPWWSARVGRRFTKRKVPRPLVYRAEFRSAPGRRGCTGRPRDNNDRHVF